MTIQAGATAWVILSEKGEARTMTESPAYGLWPLVLINSAVFIIFAFSFAKPRTERDWRSFGAFSAFLVALFTEMYGFPLTIYLFSGWIVARYPGLDAFSHEAGHLWGTLLGWQADPHLSPLHLLSYAFIAAGFILLSAAWKVLYKAQRDGQLATTGPYARVRHPQYSGFVLIMFGFLLQWPTLVTLVMFPILVMMYVRLARREEREALATFGEAFAVYMTATPGFVPRIALSPQSAAPAHAARPEHVRIPVLGSTCSVGEARAIEAAIRRLPGVVSVYANPAAEAVFIEFDPHQAGISEFRAAIEDAGVKAT